MRRRIKSDDNGSLDLLLDTLCNTFGGILLISLLVIVLLNTTSEETASNLPSEESKVELLETAIKQQELKAEIDRLRAAVKNVESDSDDLMPKETKQLAIEVRSLQITKDRLTKQKAEKVTALAKLQQQVNKTAEKNENLATKLEQAQRKLAALRKQVDAEVDERSRTAQVPKLERSTKNPETFLLTAGKLYGPAYANDEIILKTIAGVGTKVSPNTSLGTKLTGSKSDVAKIEAKFRSINPSTSDVTLFIWDDSFEHYETVLEVLEQKNLKCSLQPMTGPNEFIGVAGSHYSQ